MDESQARSIGIWLVSAGLVGTSEIALHHGFCQRCVAAGLPVARGTAIIDTLHPTFEGRAFLWLSHEEAEQGEIEFGRTSHGEAAEEWRRSVFFHLLETGRDEHRCLFERDDASAFERLIKMRSEGLTDVVSFVHRFDGAGTVGEMDCFYSNWSTDRPGGFAAADLDALRSLVPTLALAIKCRSLARITETLTDVYLGRGAGQRILEGRILRGVAERIGAVLWFSDLRGYTAISDSASPDAIIPFLNDYADAVISSIHEAGGDVLKFVGDGILAIFQADLPAEACGRALAAQAAMQSRVTALNVVRSAAGKPITDVTLGLHVGEVFFGNIGSEDRLDFTVVGPAVNEVSRISALCRSVGRPVVISSDFVEATEPGQRQALVSVGRYALRGVRRAKELFTLDGAEPLS